MPEDPATPEIEIVDVEALPENRAPVSTEDEPGMEVPRDYVNELVANLADPPATVPFTEVDVRGHLDNRILAQQDKLAGLVAAVVDGSLVRQEGALGAIEVAAVLGELQELRLSLFGSKLDLDVEAGSVASGFEAHVEP